MCVLKLWVSSFYLPSFIHIGAGMLKLQRVTKWDIFETQCLCVMSYLLVYYCELTNFSVLKSWRIVSIVKVKLFGKLFAILNTTDTFSTKVVLLL